MHPVSLQTAHNKIIVKKLASRLKGNSAKTNIFSKIWDAKSRFIGEGVRLIPDLKGYILIFDTEKALNSLKAHSQVWDNFWQLKVL